MSQKDEKIEQLLVSIKDYFDLDDRSVRESQVQQWRMLKLYWEGIQKVWYSEVAHDWRTPAADSEQNSDQEYYDKPINVFRAYLESIIAALSITTPQILCAPEDAENQLDVATARAGTKIGRILSKRNESTLLWIHALFIYATEGMVACYHRTVEDAKFGIVEEEVFEEVQEVELAHSCPVCTAPLETGEDQKCPECGEFVTPLSSEETIEKSRLVDILEKPRSSQVIDVYGGLCVKVPNYARTQAEFPYLEYSYETHFVNAIEKYPHLKDEFADFKSGSISEPYEQYARLNPQYHGEYPDNNVTISCRWYRPAAYNIIADEEDVEYLRKEFPSGVKVDFVNDVFAEAIEANLDDDWTVTRNPLADHVHFDPAGKALTSVQDITNDIISLVLQTIEHGIPQTFADPDTLDFEGYQKLEATPGSIYPAKPRASKTVRESFHEIKTATLSGEVLPFIEFVQGLGQLASGSLPSLFGGAGDTGSKTAAEYSMSRAQALQRLQTPWKMLIIFWQDIFRKAIPAYIENVIDDEVHVERDESGNFVNSIIRKSELEGKIGDITYEASEQLPATWAQSKDVVMNLLQMNHPAILEMLGSPENLPFLKDAVGLNEFTIPGEKDRQKQNEEIQLLLESEPMLVLDEMEGEKEIPSVEVDILLDNHQIEAEICRSFLISDSGRLAKQENPSGYRNVLLHMKAHLEILQATQQEIGATPDQPKPEMPDSAPIQEVRNAIR